MGFRLNDNPPIPVTDVSAHELLERYCQHRSDLFVYGTKTSSGDLPVFTKSERDAVDEASDQLPILHAEIIRRMESFLWVKP